MLYKLFKYGLTTIKQIKGSLNYVYNVRVKNVRDVLYSNISVDRDYVISYQYIFFIFTIPEQHLVRVHKIKNIICM